MFLNISYSITPGVILSYGLRPRFFSMPLAISGPYLCAIVGMIVLYESSNDFLFNAYIFSK